MSRVSGPVLQYYKIAARGCDGIYVFLFWYCVFRINSTVQIVEHKEAFRTSNALEIMRGYDILSLF